MNPNHFGDIIDYRKYGLLRLLGRVGRVKSTICWMLTPGGAGGGGGDTRYLRRPKKWRHFDSELFDFLYDEVVIRCRVRNVRALDGANVLPGCRFFSDLVPGHAGPRGGYFERLLEFARGAELVFFDPDTGIRMQSARIGQRRSTKHLYKDEVSVSFAAGHSVLMYQHFELYPRVPRERFIDKLGQDLGELTGVEDVFSYRTPKMVFFLVPQREHGRRFLEANIEVERQ